MLPYGGAIRGFFRFLPALSLGLLCAAMLAPPVHAVPPKYFDVPDATVVLAEEDIAVRLSINVDNLTGLYEMLKDGASVELLVNARLERVRSFWTNVALAEMELFSTLQHNPLTREFSLHMPGETKPMLDKDLDRLLAATWRKYVVHFGPVSILDGERGSEYRIALTLNLQHAKPPPWLGKDFMLWSQKIVDPERMELPFRY
jgi:hypothetical protein